MRRLEIIHLRSSGAPVESLGELIRESVWAESRGVADVTLYRRRGLETDIAVHIRHREREGTHEPSALAIHLA